MLTPEVKELMDKLEKEWNQFKVENDRRIKEMETKGGKADPLTENKIDKHSSAIGDLQKQVTEMLAKLNRPGVAPGDEKNAEVAEHRKLFNSYMRKGDAGCDVSRLTELQVKQLQIGVDGDGGFAVPEELDRTIGRMEIAAMPMEAAVTSITAGAETYEKLFDLRGTTSGWVAEAEARPETSTPQFGAFMPKYGELYCNPFATQKMLDDAFFDVEAWLAMSISEKFSQDVDNAILNGNGAGKPMGIFSYPFAATADSARPYGTIEKLGSGSSASFTVDNLIDLMQKLKPGYRQNARWLVAQATVGFIRKLKDSQNRYLWEPSTQAGQPASLLGYAVLEDDNVPAMAASALAVLFGDLKRAYKFVNIRGIRVLRDPFTSKPRIGFYTTKRVGGGVEDTGAIKVLQLI